MNILRRLPLSRLLLLCALVVALGVSATALALALGAGPTPPPRPLAEAVHDALLAPAVQGVSARIQLTDHLLEGANLTGEGGESLDSSPLLSGASGRLWISKDGRMRLELQSEKGDTQILYDGHTISLYDAATNTLYRYTPPPPRERGASAGSDTGSAQAPSVAKIEEAISKLSEHALLSSATPTDIAGQAAYTVRISPKQGGSLIGGAELSWDAVHGVPLRAAIYSSTSSSPVIELATSEISYGPVASSVFEFTPPAGAKIDEPGATRGAGAKTSGPRARRAERPRITTSGSGPAQILILESKRSSPAGGSSPQLPERLPKVNIDGASATELGTALGTLLTFERSGVRYVLLGAVTPAAVEAVARGL